jgi:hypothetical protein
VNRVAMLLAAAVAAGCGVGETEGTASVWITRDRGSKVLLVRTVPAGLTAMQALRRVADVKTRYGGRFVQAVNGLEGSLAAGRDWFYFVNGIAADRGAAEYRLHAGDVEWWDYRSWRGSPEVGAVVGAFPEPFLHGYGGRRPPAAISCLARNLEATCRRLGKIVRADGPPSPRANVLVVRDRAGPFSVELRGSHRVRFVIGARDARRLARNPRLARFRYRGLR